MAGGNIHFDADGVLLGEIDWSATSNGTAANSSTVNAIIYARRTDNYATTGRSWGGYVKIEWNNGITSGSATEPIEFDYSLTVDGDWTEMAVLSGVTVPHRNDGTMSVKISGEVSGPSGTALAGRTSTSKESEENVNLDTIPRYTSITSFTVTKRNETSVTYSFTTADICDYAYYSTNDGSSWTGVDITDGKSASFNVTGLSPNTTYNFKLKVRRKDSGLETISSRVQQTTYKTPTQSLSSKTETSITMNWNIDSTADYIWYSKDNGTNWVAVGSVNATSGSYTINNLTANTAYNIKTRVRRKAPQTTYDTSASSQTTYNYPYVSAVGTSALTIGNSQTLNLYNPLSRSVTVKMYQNSTSGTQLYSGTTSGTSITFTPTANTLYASIPNSSSGNCVYSVIYGNSTKTTGTYTYKIVGNETPTFTDFTYADTNSTTTALTGNNQILIKGYSNVTATVSVANKAVANNSASMLNYVLSIGNQSAQTNYSSSSDVTMSINNVTVGEIKVIANDSRSLSTFVTKTATIKDYFKPATTELTATRGNNGVGEQVTLAFRGSWWNDSFGSQANAIQSIQYYFKKTTDQNWTTGSTTITWTTSGNTFSGELVVYGDTTTHGFDVTSSYYIKIVVTDRLDYSVEYQTTIGSGTPAIAVYKDNVAIGQQYNTSDNYKLQVNGSAIFNGTTVFKDSPNNTGTSEGGEIQLHAPRNGNAQAGTIIDNYQSKCRIFGIPSKDGTSKTGAGTPLEIDPYGKTLGGNYKLNGTSTNAEYWMPTDGAGFTSDQYGNLRHKRSNDTDVWQMRNSAGTVKATYNWEAGTWDANATKDGNGVNIASGYTHAGVITSGNLNNVATGQELQRSCLITINNGTWYNLINVRHRNGEGDGTSYGMQIISPLQSTQASLQIRNQSAGSWGGWDNIWRYKNLYNNATGSNGTVTLSETSANFNYLDIYFRSNDGNAYVSSTRVYAPNGKYPYLNYIYNSGTNTTMYQKFAQAYINGTTITLSRAKQHSYSNGSTATVTEDNNIYIVRVDGCR